MTRKVEVQVGREHRGHGPAVARLPPNPNRRIWAFVSVLALAAFFAARTVASLPVAIKLPVPIPFLLVVAGTALCEWLMFEVRYRADSQTFTLSELSLALGIAYVSPTQFMVAQIVGLGIVFTIRKATPVRAVFNLANSTLTTAVAFGIARTLQGTSPSPESPQMWFTTLAALAVASLLASALISVVRSVAEWRWLIHDLWRMTLFSVLNAMATGTIGVIAATTTHFIPALTPLVLVPLMLTYTAFRLFVNEHTNRTNVEFLYEATKTLHRTTDTDRALIDMLEGTRTVFRAKFAMVSIARPDRDSWLRFALTDDETASSRGDGSPAWIPETDTTRIIDATSGQRERRLLEELGIKHAMVRRIRGEAGLLGLIVVADRIGGVHAFSKKDRYLFDVLANQIAVGLENTHLERSLGELSRLEEQLRHQANHDTLTGLPNRALLSAALGDGTRTRRTVLLIDLDDFKTINDSLGHAAGDCVLVEVAQRLRACIRSGDLVARLGGDEFAVLLQSDNMDVATQTATRIAAELDPPMRVADNDLVVRGSVGVAHVEPGELLSDALRNADVAMYEAKRTGKGSHRVFETAMVESAHERLMLVTRLRQAIDNGEFSLRYQPIVKLTTREVVSVETLLRWDHPELGLLMPDRFISIAEDSGLIVEIGLWVLRRACLDVRDLMSDSGNPLFLSVNIAVRQLLESDFVARLRTVLTETEFSPDRLVLEITESAALIDKAAVHTAVAEVQGMGIRLALDDFGTGYSSLAVAHGFPLDFLKIDKLFIQGGDLSLARAIVALAGSLGLVAIAEGIEDEDQIAKLLETGCELGQGFAFSRPLPIDELTVRLRKSTLVP